MKRQPRDRKPRPKEDKKIHETSCHRKIPAKTNRRTEQRIKKKLLPKEQAK